MAALVLGLCALVAGGCGDSDPGPRPVDAKETVEAAPPLDLPMVAVPTSTFPLDGKQVTVPAFEIDTFEVTNDAFAAFVEATDYVTDAEQIGNSVVFDYDWQRSPGEHLPRSVRHR